MAYDDYDCLSFTELEPKQLVDMRFREIVLDTGAAQNTLQDFKLPGSAGGYTYNDSNSWMSPSCNRFIHWKAQNDVLELCEVSLDHNLVGNNVRIRILNTPILDGISVHETPDQIYILVATIGSVHRLVFPHPRKLNPCQSSPQQLSSSFRSSAKSSMSIFANFTSDALRDPHSYHVLNCSASSLTGSASFPITCCSWLTSQRECIFVLANSNSTLTVVKLHSHSDFGKVASWELKQSTIMSRLWSGLVPSIIRGNQEGDDAAVFLVSHQFEEDHLVFALCKDLRLRVWSYMKQECLLSHYVLSRTPGTNALNLPSVSPAKLQAPLTVRRTLLRKSNEPLNDGIYLAAFIGAIDQRLFVIFEPCHQSGHVSLRYVGTVSALEHDLVDFTLTRKHIWAIWLGSDSELITSYISLDSSCHTWQTVLLSQQFAPALSINSMMSDPRELYLDYIFYRSNFSLHTIAKAISIINRIPESGFICEKTDTLIKEATKLIENKTLSRIGAMELTAEEYNQIELESWEKFHSYCLQYHSVSTKPLGLIMDPRTGLISILKKSSLSFIRPNDLTDHLIINSVNTQNLLNIITEDAGLEVSLGRVLKGVELISNSLSEENAMQFELGLASGESPVTLATDIIENHLLLAIDYSKPNGRPLKASFDNMFIKTTQLIETIDLILRCLNLDARDQVVDVNDSGQHTLPFLAQFLNSNAGICLLSETVKQMSRLRFNFSRDLLLFQLFILQVKEKVGLSSDKMQLINSNTIPTTGLFCQAYYFMTWVCETTIKTPFPSVSPDDLASLLALLELNEYINVVPQKGGQILIQEDFGVKSMLAHFLENQGNIVSRKLLSAKLNSTDCDSLPDLMIWSSVLPQFALSVAKLIWPISSSFEFAQFLVGSGQCQLLLEYNRLLDQWCQRNAFSRQFIKGFCFLVSGEHEKAVHQFTEAIFGINQELFLIKIFKTKSVDYDMQPENSHPTSQEMFVYYNKLIQLFKFYSHYESIVQLATQAILMISGASSNELTEEMASLYSTQFMCHLELGNSTEAYQAMVINPDLSQRKVCLRQFIVHHCEQGLLDDLIDFSYSDLDEDFVAIMESRARSSNVMTNDDDTNIYYNVLYSFFVRDNNFRRGAGMMYEYSRRLAQEVHGRESIIKQCKCLLLTLNSLKLVDEKYAWIIEPTLKKVPSSSQTTILGTTNAKRSYEGLDIEPRSGSDLMGAVKREIITLDCSDIKAKYELLRARVKLIEKDETKNAIALTPLSASETISLLISNSMFDLAFDLSTLFELPYEPVFEGLVSTYLYRLEVGDNGTLDDHLSDLFTENSTVALSFIGNSSTARPIDRLWHLISFYIGMYEVKGQHSVHRCVAQKLLESGVSLPSSLRISYQQVNCPELMLLLIKYNDFEEAVNVSLNYMESLMTGKGGEYFNITTPILPNAKPIYFPHPHVNCLMEILVQNDSVEYKEMKKQLVTKYDAFKRLLLQISSN